MPCLLNVSVWDTGDSIVDKMESLTSWGFIVAWEWISKQVTNFLKITVAKEKVPYNSYLSKSPIFKFPKRFNGLAEPLLWRGLMLGKCPWEHQSPFGWPFLVQPAIVRVACHAVPHMKISILRTLQRTAWVVSIWGFSEGVSLTGRYFTLSVKGNTMGK